MAPIISKIYHFDFCSHKETSFMYWFDTNLQKNLKHQLIFEFMMYPLDPIIGSGVIEFYIRLHFKQTWC